MREGLESSLPRGIWDLMKQIDLAKNCSEKPKRPPTTGYSSDDFLNLEESRKILAATRTSPSMWSTRGILKGCTQCAWRAIGRPEYLVQLLPIPQYLERNDLKKCMFLQQVLGQGTQPATTSRERQRTDSPWSLQREQDHARTLVLNQSYQIWTFSLQNCKSKFLLF